MTTILAATFVALLGVWLLRCFLGRCSKQRHDVSVDLTERCISHDTAYLEQENQLLKRDVSRYANIINSSVNPVWMRDASMKVIYCNLAFSSIAEETDEALDELGEMELYNGHRQLAKKAWETGQEQVERRHVVAEGDRKLYQIREVPFKKEGLVIGYAADLHELEEAHNEIERHVGALRDLLGSSTSAMAIYGRDARLKFYNFAFATLWKFDESWLDTEPNYGEVLEQLREKRKLPEQANFQAFKQAQLKLFTSLIDTQEEFFYLPDGKVLRVIAIPHALGGILFAYEDVTDRLALERSYNTLIAVQRETLDNLREGVAVFGENGRLKLSNPIFLSLWNIAPETAAAEPHMRDVLEHCREYFDVDSWTRFSDVMLSRLQQRKHFTERFERADGSVVDCANVPLPDGATLLTFSDVTDSTVVERSLREKNEALEAADRMKTEFLANVSYELRSPLTSISGFSEMLKANYFGELNDTQRDYVESIFTSAQHLGTMIGNIIDLASIEAGYLRLEPESFLFSQACGEVLALLGERIRAQGTTIVKQHDESIGEIYADETRVKQIIYNLLSHALKLCKQKGEIHIHAIRRDGGGVVLDILGESRTAPSGDNEDLGRVTEPTTDIGLSIAKRFTELHGGTLSIDNQNGRGVRIHCVLPDLLHSPIEPSKAQA